MRIAEKLEMEERAMGYITDFLTDNENKPTPFTEIAKFYDDYKKYNVSTTALRRAVWYLIDDGKIEFDGRNNLRLRV